MAGTDQDHDRDPAHDRGPGQQQQEREPEASHGGHGTSLAAWVVCGGVITGAFVVALSMIIGTVTFAFVGGAIIVVSTLAGPVLNRAGFGDHGTNHEVTGQNRAVR